MIIISCPSCNKPVEATHAYKVREGVAWHVDCTNPMAGPTSGKSIDFNELPDRGRDNETKTVADPHSKPVQE